MVSILGVGLLVFFRVGGRVVNRADLALMLLAGAGRRVPDYRRWLESRWEEPVGGWLFARASVFRGRIQTGANGCCRRPGIPPPPCLCAREKW